MTTSHTPGPWRTVGGTEVRAGVGVICETAQYRAPTLSQQAVADARLIAAAPELLSALQQALKWADQDCPVACMHEVQKVRAIIARATNA